MKYSQHIKRGITWAIVYAVVFIVILGIFGGTSANRRAASTRREGVSQEYKDLNYTATMDTHGDLHIKQRVTIDLHRRDSGPWRGITQKFQLNESDVTSISDISVTDAKTGQAYTYRSYSEVDPYKVGISDWNEQAAKSWFLKNSRDDTDFNPDTDALHVKNSKYADIQEGDFKYVTLGWCIPVTYSGTYTFDVSMTFKNLAGKLKDGAYFAWEPVSDTNEVPIHKMTVKVVLPQGVSQSYGWLHTDSSESTTKRVNDREYSFSVKNVKKDNYVDFIAAYQGADSYSDVQRSYTHDDIEKVKSSEYNKLQSARAESANTRRTLSFYGIMIIFALSIAIAIVIWLIYGAQSTLKLAQYRGEQDYNRDPPSVSPAAAAHIYALITGHPKDKEIKSRALNATILSLVSKGALMILPGAPSTYKDIDLDNVKSQDMSSVMSTVTSQGYLAQQSKVQEHVMTFVLASDIEEKSFSSKHHLSNSEWRTARVLMMVGENVGSYVFSSKDLANQAREASMSRNTTNKFAERVKSMYNSQIADFDRLHVSEYPAWQRGWPLTIGWIYAIVTAHFGMRTSYWAAYILIAVVVLAFTGFAWGYGAPAILTEKNKKKVSQVYGLAHYLEDFSSFTDRGVTDMKLWDRYLVYATAFGMSETVMKELRSAYIHDMDVAQSANADIDPWQYYMYDDAMLSWMWMPWVNNLTSNLASRFTPNIDTTMMGSNSDFFNADFSSFDGFMDSFNTSMDSVNDAISIAGAWSAPSTGSGSSGGGTDSGGSFDFGGFDGGGGGGGGGSFGGF
ncbi:DUF2207 family protein [Alloscardovia venturai]|uniref:DUF2207 family protein n=1 Tax=Alloscardovia venturai TaxID=1769421 RepID=A0ABW2Y830_9BIFI